ncbi:MAG TPA: metal ABC transporter substrate-binding protein [Chthoniobacterales bacterium]|nr:metal ABC transporter substrate-binding protein [Chthoniobacterales bacterium]
MGSTLRAVSLCFLFFSTAKLYAEIKVASFSTILSEIAQKVGGKNVAVTSLIKPGQDPHEYQLTPGDLSAAAAADLVLLSGKGMEETYLRNLRDTLPKRVQMLEVGDQLPGLTKGMDEGKEAQKATMEDPHWWNSALEAEKATALVRDALIRLDGLHIADYQAGASAYLAELKELDSWAKRKIAELPRNRRKLVTSHDAFQYFAKDYGFQIDSIEGLTTEQEPSVSHVTALIAEIKKEGVKAIFLENTLNPKVSIEITRESGAKIGGTLYADGLGPGEGETYAGMIRHNVNTIVDALK